MDNVGGMKVVDGAKQIVKDYFCMLHVKRNVLIFIKNLGKILIYMIHHQEDAWGLFPALSLRNNDIYDLNSEDVVLHGREASENCDLSVNSFSAVDAVKSVLNIFYGYCFVC